MLYIIFLYQHESGQLLYDKSFQDIGHEKLELFSDFFLILKAFITEIVITREQDLRSIDLDEYSVLITTISEIKVDLVIIADKEDNKLVEKIIPKMMRVLINKKELFLNRNGSRDSFNILDLPISEVIKSQSKLSGKKTLIEKPIGILKSIWARKEELSSEQINNLIHERDKLLEKFDELTHIPTRLVTMRKMLEISENLKDEARYLKYHEDVKQLSGEIYEAKTILKHYLGRIKDTVNEAVNNLKDKPVREGHYRDVFLNLYSFSTKLKYLSSNNNWREFRYIAKMLIEKNDFSESEIAAGITKILKMKEDVEYYVN